MLIPKKCSECGGNLRWENNDGLVCEKCGLVVNKSVIYSGERVLV